MAVTICLLSTEICSVMGGEVLHHRYLRVMGSLCRPKNLAPVQKAKDLSRDALLFTIDVV